MRPAPRVAVALLAIATPAATLLLAAAPAAAWGPLGHRMVAETAALLLERDGHPWGPILGRHRVELGVYSTYPDACFRHEDGAGGAVEAPTHKFQLDPLLGPERGATARARLDALGCREREVQTAARSADADAFGREVGTAPWRIAGLIGQAAAELGQARQPRGGYLPGRTAGGDAGHVFRGLYLLGVAAHYTGDAAMPYHATADWNGYATGQGGIHFFFESDCVNALEPGLASAVLEAATRHRRDWLAGWGAGDARPERVLRRVFLDSLEAVPRLARRDRERVLLAPSPADGKSFAKRRPASSSCSAFRDLLVERLAKAATLTAWAWERALPAATDLSQAGDLQFADMVLAPTFIAPEPDAGCGGAAGTTQPAPARAW